MPWQSNELLGAAQNLLDIYGNTDHAAELTAAGLTPANLITALTTPRDSYGDAEQV